MREIDAQIPDLLQRHRLLRSSALTTNYATIIFFLNRFVIAIAALVNVTWASNLALYSFLAATALLTWGVALSTLEIRNSDEAVEHDLARIKEVPRANDAASNHDFLSKRG